MACSAYLKDAIVFSNEVIGTRRQRRYMDIINGIICTYVNTHLFKKIFLHQHRFLKFERVFLRFYYKRLILL